MGAVFAMLALSACDTSSPSQLQTGKMRVTNRMVAETLDARRVDPARIAVIADDYMRRGKGDMTVTVSYLAGDDYMAVAADKQGRSYRDAFARRGVSGVSVVTAPTSDRRFTGQVVVTYRALTALQAKDCTRLPGYQGAETVPEMDHYKIGCEMQAAMSKMVADPSDLLGKAGTQDGDSRRNGTIIEKHNAGTPNERMQGFQASQVGGGGE
jgi:pilus biogenesis lipoprotein CpaD